MPYRRPAERNHELVVEHEPSVGAYAWIIWGDASALLLSLFVAPADAIGFVALMTALATLVALGTLFHYRRAKQDAWRFERRDEMLRLERISRQGVRLVGETRIRTAVRVRAVPSVDSKHLATRVTLSIDGGSAPIEWQVIGRARGQEVAERLVAFLRDEGLQVTEDLTRLYLARPSVRPHTRQGRVVELASPGQRELVWRAAEAEPWGIDSWVLAIVGLSAALVPLVLVANLATGVLPVLVVIGMLIALGISFPLAQGEPWQIEIRPDGWTVRAGTARRQRVRSGVGPLSARVVRDTVELRDGQQTVALVGSDLNYGERHWLAKRVSQSALAAAEKPAGAAPDEDQEEQRQSDGD